MSTMVKQNKGPDVHKQNELVTKLLEFGYPEALARLAVQHESSIHLCMDWICNHPNALEEEALKNSALESTDGNTTTEVAGSKRGGRHRGN